MMGNTVEEHNILQKKKWTKKESERRQGDWWNQTYADKWDKIFGKKKTKEEKENE